jgi:hypothetical protein
MTPASECPDPEKAAEFVQDWSEYLVVGEFVGSDFFEPLLRCHYDLVYKCRENRGGGLIDLGGF